MRNPFGRLARLLRLQKNAQASLDAFERAKAQPQLYERSAFWDTALIPLRALVLDLPVADSVKGLLQMKNWKTSLSGIAALVALAAKVVNGHFDPTTDIAIATGAIGLIFSKDRDVTGVGSDAHRE
jgi:putative alpha-1,2-mannosidase